MMHWIMFLLTMVALIVMALVPPQDLETHQKVKLAIYFFMFGLIGFLMGSKGNPYIWPKKPE